MEYLFRIWSWTMVARWRTWLAHGVIAALLTFVVGGWPVIVLFLARELEQAFTEALAGVQSDWVDHLADFAVPFVVVVLLGAFGIAV